MNKMTDKELERLAKDKRNEYQRKWRKENPKKVKEYAQRHWTKKALEELEGEGADNE